ncbi:hypothetical protein O3P69_006750 [Scylla paramamosain]|uniref:Uncharacterized protein n=1 Tax=Scylla paramamosain TaxID=85552 RepID=A0AAW0U4E2_SCYPA
MWGDEMRENKMYELEVSTCEFWNELVALCLMAAGVSAQYGESGIVFPDGRLKQFTREEADNVAEIGESGVVF